MKRLANLCVLTVMLIFVVGMVFIVTYNTTVPKNGVKISEPNFVDLINTSNKSTVHIRCQYWQGSGFVLTPNIIGTARHVVDGINDFIITTNDGHKLHATRAFSDKTHDIGYIYIDDLTCILDVAEHKHSFDKQYYGYNHKVKLAPVKLGSIKECHVGQEVLLIGSPYGYINFNAANRGWISGLDRDLDFTDRYTGEKYGWNISFTSDAAAHPGNSGCPVFTLDGKVRGILVGGFSPVLNIIMPVDIFMHDLDEIESIFIQDKYQKEVSITRNNYYNYIENNEYYKVK